MFILLNILQTCCVRSTDLDYGCKCGDAEQGADNMKPNVSTTPYDMPTFRSGNRKNQNTKSRIVGGYSPKERPWMALLELEHAHYKHRGYSRKKNSQCGGAIINKVRAICCGFSQQKSGTNLERVCSLPPSFSFMRYRRVFTFSICSTAWNPE